MAYAKFATMATSFKSLRFALKPESSLWIVLSAADSRLYSWQNWELTVRQFEKLDVMYCNLLRRMIRGGIKPIGDNFCTTYVRNYIRKQKDYAGHVFRMLVISYSSSSHVVSYWMLWERTDV